MAIRSSNDKKQPIGDDGKPLEMKFEEVQIARRGQQLILPEGMEINEGIEWLRRFRNEEEQLVGIYLIVEAFPLDGAFAFHAAVNEIYGFTSTSWATMVSMPISHNENVQVPWGVINIPGIEGELATGLDLASGLPKFIIQGRVKKKYQAQIHKIHALTMQKVREHSVYRGKAITVQFDFLDRGQMDPMEDAPKFMDLSNVDPDELIFNRTTEKLINMTLFSLVENTSAMRKNGVPLKKGVLLSGKYGTGKTKTALVAAKKAVENGWTFIYLSNVKQLATAIRFAAQYAPAVLFAEDVDNAVGLDRGTDVNNILNTIDGVDSKDKEIITVLTTNHLEKINPAMLRPGRLDAVVTIEEPDSEAAIRLMKTYARGLIDPNADLTPAANVLAGQIPAFIREAVERAKVAAIAEFGENIENKVTGEHIETAALLMKGHWDLVKPKPADPRSPFQQVGESLGMAVVKGMVESEALHLKGVGDSTVHTTHAQDVVNRANRATTTH